jgi:hypothetical protein
MSACDKLECLSETQTHIFFLNNDKEEDYIRAFISEKSFKPKLIFDPRVDLIKTFYGRNLRVFVQEKCIIVTEKWPIY